MIKYSFKLGVWHNNRAKQIYVDPTLYLSLFSCFYCRKNSALYGGHILEHPNTEPLCYMVNRFWERLMYYYLHPDSLRPECPNFAPLEDYVFFLKTHCIRQSEGVILKRMAIPFVINKKKKITGTFRVPLLR